MSYLTEKQRNRISKFALYGLLLFIAYATADLSIIYYRDRFIPSQPPPLKNINQPISLRTDRGQYSVITGRNLFNSNGIIPDPLKPLDSQEKRSDTPVLSSLPLTLIGTLVHSNPEKSVAAVEIKSKNMSGSYSVGAEIEGMAKVEAIERGLLYFRNLNNGALEYIEMNQGNNKVSFDAVKKTVPSGATTASRGEIEKVGNNTFKMKRADLNKYLGDLNALLMQARAIPNRDPNTGEINGFRLVDFQPGSIFDQLGLPRGTLIKSAGGEPVTNVQAAMEMFNKMKTSNSVKLGVEINGADQTYTYEIQ